MSLSCFTGKPLEIILAPPKYIGSPVHEIFSMTFCHLLPLSLGRNSTCQNRKIPLLYLYISRTRKETLKSSPNRPELFCNLVKSFCLREVLRRSQLYLRFFYLFCFLAYMSISLPTHPSSGSSSGRRWAFYKSILKFWLYSSFLSCRRNKNPGWGHRRKKRK